MLSERVGNRREAVKLALHQPAQMKFSLPEGERYRGEVINIWDMTVTTLDEPVVRGAVVQLPGKPYHALILRRVD